MTAAQKHPIPPRLPRLAGGPPVARIGAAGWRSTLALTLTVTGLAAVIGLGAWAFLQQLLYGEAVTGMGTIGAGGVTWGLYIVFMVFFIGVSFAGMALAGSIRLLGLEHMRPFSRIAGLLTIVSLAMGGLCVVADLGRPLAGLLGLPQYARPASPFFGSFSLVIGGYLFASLVFFFVSCRSDAAWCATHARRFGWLYRLLALGYRGTAAERDRHHRASFWLSVTILPLLVVALSTEGFIFGIQGGRPGWFSALQGPSFVVMAGISGVGMLIVLSALIRRYCGLRATLAPEGFRWLGNVLLVLTVVYIYFMISEELTATYAGIAADARVANEVVFGSYAGMFWLTAACLVGAAGLLFAQFVSGRAWVGATVTSGVLVTVAAVLKRYLIVVPSQTHGTLLAWPVGHYTPTWVELGFVAGLFALAALAVLVFVRVFPIIPMTAPDAAADGLALDEGASRRRLRLALTWGTLTAGATMAAIGFLYSARFGTLPYLDPVLPFAPTLFIAGVVTCFASAIVYEVVPSAPQTALELDAGAGEPPKDPGETLAEPRPEIPRKRATVPPRKATTAGSA